MNKHYIKIKIQKHTTKLLKLLKLKQIIEKFNSIQLVIKTITTLKNFNPKTLLKILTQ